MVSAVADAPLALETTKSAFGIESTSEAERKEEDVIDVDAIEVVISGDVDVNIGSDEDVGD